MDTMIFKNRREAGRQLATALIKRGYLSKNTLVLGIPRGGLVVADEVAKALSAALDVVIARKLRAPYQPELGIGAVVDGDHIVLNEEVVRSVAASQDYLNRSYEVLALHRLVVENGARKITLVIPYLGYARQDRPCRPGEGSIGVMVIELLQKTNPSEMIFFDVHSESIRKTFRPFVKELSALPLIAQALTKHPPHVIVSPDAGFVSGAERLSRLFKPKPALSVIEKVRPKPNVAIAKYLHGDVRGKDVLIVDDIIDTGGTLSEAVKLVSQNGARNIHLAATHGIFSGEARDRLSRLPIKEILVTNTLPQILSPKIRILDMMPLILNALARA